MKFINLHIQNFKCFKNDYIWTFSEGLNLVFGPNESGKTSLYQALVLSLFGPHTSARKHFGDFSRDDFIPLGSNNMPVLEISFSLSGEQYSVKRDFDTTRVFISHDDPTAGKQYEEFQVTKAKEFIKKMLGGVEEEIFTKYASINHVDLARLDASKYRKENEEMGESLIKLVESRHGAGLIDVRKNIKDYLKELTREKSNLTQNLSETRQKFIEARSFDEELGILKAEVHEKTTEYDNLLERKSELDSIVSGIAARRTSSREIMEDEKHIKENEEEYHRIKKVTNEYDTLVEKLDKFPESVQSSGNRLKNEMDDLINKRTALEGQLFLASQTLEDKKKKVENISKDFDTEYGSFKGKRNEFIQFKERDNELIGLVEKQKEIQIRIESVTSQIEQAKRRKKQLIMQAAGVLVLGLIILLIIITQTPERYLLMYLIVPVIFAGFAGVFFLQASRALSSDILNELKRHENDSKANEGQQANLKSIITQLSNRLGSANRHELEEKYENFRSAERELEVESREIPDFEKSKERILNDLDGISKRLNLILNETGCSSLNELKNLLTEFDNITLSLKNQQERIDKENIFARLEKLEKDIATDKITLNEMKKQFQEKFAADPMTEEEFFIRKEELDSIDAKLQDLTQQKNELSGRIIEKENQLEDGCEVLEERVFRIEKAIDLLSSKIEELEYISTIINEMASAYKLEFLPNLEKRARDLFSSFAGTSNKTFTLSDGPSINISSTELKGFDERHLSQGTRDQLYFALRIAWCDILTPEDLRLPLIWDDPFVYWDKDRTNGACKIVDKLVENGHQIIIFTHRPELIEQMKTCFVESEINILSLSTS